MNGGQLMGRNSDAVDGKASLRTFDEFMDEPGNFLWFLILAVGFIIFDIVTLRDLMCRIRWCRDKI